MVNVSASARPLDLREACVAEAFAIVGERGLEGLSLREVARRLGVSHQAPYKHFESRDHILAEIVRRAFHHFGAALDARAASGDAVEDSLAMGRAYVNYASAHPLHYHLMFGAPLPKVEDHPDMMKSARHAFALLRDGLERVFVSKGASPSPADLDLEALFVWICVHGLASLKGAHAMSALDLPPETRARLADHIHLRIGSALGVAPTALRVQQGDKS